MNSCMAHGSSKSYCSCALDTFQSQYSQQEFVVRDAEMQVTGKFPESFVQTLRQVGLQCKQ